MSDHRSNKFELVWSCVRHVGIFILMFVMLGVTACGGVGSIVSAVATGTTGNDTGTTTNSASADALSDQETGLFEDGPVDLPVTIAKLESPDVTKIVVSADPVSPSVSAPLNNSRYSTTDPTVAYTVTGAAGAVHDPVVTPYVYLFNDNNDVDEFCEVSSNGSFSCAVLGDLADDLYLFASTASDLSTAEMSPPLHIVMDDFGVVAVGDTNSTGISADFSVATDSSGNYYLIVLNSTTGLSNFYRRNVDGSLLQTIWTEDDAESVLTPTKIESINENFVIFFDQDGKLHQVQLTETNASIATSFLTGVKPRFTLTTDVTDIDSLNDNLDDQSPSIGGYRLQVIYDSATHTIPEYIVAYYPYLFASNGSAAAVLQVSETDGILNTSDSLSDEETVSTYSGLRMKATMNTSTKGFAVIEDPHISGCSTSSVCLGIIDKDGLNHDTETYDDMEVLTGRSFPTEVRGVVSSAYDDNYVYVVALEGIFQYNKEQAHSEELSDENIPSSIVISNDDRYVVGCCDGNICGFSTEARDFVDIWDEEEDLCDFDNPPEIDTENNVHFYDALGQHRGIYQTSNSDLFEEIERTPPGDLD